MTDRQTAKAIAKRAALASVRRQQEAKERKNMGKIDITPELITPADREADTVKAIEAADERATAKAARPKLDRDAYKKARAVLAGLAEDVIANSRREGGLRKEDLDEVVRLAIEEAPSAEAAIRDFVKTRVPAFVSDGNAGTFRESVKAAAIPLSETFVEKAVPDTRTTAEVVDSIPR